MMTTKRIELWECDNCGARSINGKGGEWAERGDERFHACAGLAGALTPQTASRLAITTTVTVPAASLVELLYGVRRWAADEDGVPDEMWPAYLAAHEALRLPRPEAKS